MGWTDWSSLNRTTGTACSTLLTGTRLVLFATDPVNKKILFRAKGNSAGAQWGAWQEFGGTTDAPLSAVVFDGAFHFFAKGVNDHKIYLRSTPIIPGPKAWEEFGGTTDVGVSAVVFGEKLYVFAKGENDNKIYYRSRINGGSWGVWKEFGGTTDAAPCAAVCKNNLYLFAKGIADKQVYVCWKPEGGKWNTWQPFGITTDVPVSAVAFADDLHVFVKGLADDRIYSRFIGREDKLSDWYPIPPVVDMIDTSVAVAQFGGTLQLFVRGPLDKRIYTKSMFIYELPFEDVAGWGWGRANWDEPGGGHGPGDQSLDFDFNHAEGANVLAVRGGRVVFLENNAGNTNDPGSTTPGYGTCIHIEHDDGSTAFYMHLQFNSPAVTCQQDVIQGKIIGLSGDTGSSGAPHLHLGLQSFTNFGENCLETSPPAAKGPHMPMYFKDKLHTAPWRPAKGDDLKSSNQPS